MLGSPRVITDSQGNVISRRDFKPFGEQLDPDVGGRSSVTAYRPTNDNVKQKFTGYQKDIETGLDFAEARMNSAVKIMANRFPIGGMDWGKFEEGANSVLASGGKLDMFVTSTGRGPVDAAVKQLRHAGLQNVRAVPLGDPRSNWIWRITAQKQ